mgnify:CR=1 FL=1
MWRKVGLTQADAQNNAVDDNHKEDIDTDVATRESKSCMKQQNQDNRYGSQAVDIRSVLELRLHGWLKGLSGPL